MQKNILAILIFICGFSACFLAVPETAAAGLVPCGQKSDDAITADANEADMCTLCHLLIGIKRIVDFGTQIFIYAALTMITVGGILYIISSGDEGKMQTAKGVLKAALAGVAIVLLAWVAVNITMKALSARDKDNDGIPDFELVETGKWYEFKCE